MDAEDVSPEPIGEPAPAGETGDQPLAPESELAEPPGEGKDDELDDVFDVPKVEGKGFFVTAKKRDRMFAGLRFHEAVADLLSGAQGLEGSKFKELERIASMPDSPPEMKEAASAALTIREAVSYNTKARQFIGDIYGGNVDAAVTYLLNDSDPNVGAAIAGAVVKHLPQVAPELHQRLTGEAIQGKISSLYEQALKQNDDAMFALAQRLDLDVNGEYKTKENFAPAPKQNPEVESMRRELEQHRQAAQSARTAQVSQFVKETTTGIRDAAMKEIESALESVAHFKGKPQWRVMVADLRQKVDEASRVDGPWKQDFDLKFRQLSQTPTPQLRQALVDKVTALARQVARTHRKSVIDEFAGEAVASNQAAHAKHKAAAAKAEPGAGGAPPTIPDPLERVRQAKTFEEGLDALFPG